MSTATDVGLTPVHVVYAGLRKLTGGKPGYWYVTEAGDPFGGFDKPLVTGHRVGTLVCVQQTPEGRFITRGPDGPSALGKAEVDTETLMAWQLENDAVQAQQAKAAAERRIAREIGSPLDEALEPIRDALNRLPWNQRAAALAAILAKLS